MEELYIMLEVLLLSFGVPENVVPKNKQLIDYIPFAAALIKKECTGGIWLS
jgi:xanthosine utilization system XapX-like protein